MWPILEGAVRRLAVAGSHGAVAALGDAMERGSLFAPVRTATLRRLAAEGLARIGTPDATALLSAAAADGSWGVRRAAKAGLSRASAGADAGGATPENG